MSSTDLVTVTPDGTTLQMHFHPGQWKAWESEKRIVLVLSGSGSGKTSYGPHWLYREIRRRGPGDYMACSPTYPLMSKKMLPEFLKLFQRQLQLGSYNSQQKLFTFSLDGQVRTHGEASDTPTQVYFGHAQDPESLESATAKAVWLDEAGQSRFRLGSWEALQRRAAIHQARFLIGTTPYNLGWLKLLIYDPWEAERKAGRDHPEIDVINFDSTMNPAFPPEEFERQRQALPRWRFNMFFRGIFSRPAGLIYDAFDPSLHVVPRFRVPQEWPRAVGLDFGATNTAAVFFAEEMDIYSRRTGRLFAYREYRPGKREPEEHVRSILADEPRIPNCCGGSSSEDEWRQRFSRAGLPISEPPIRDVEVGIDTVYAACKRNELLVFEDLAGLREELATYSRELDDAGQPTDRIEDKETFHILDACRYILTKLKRGGRAVDYKQSEKAKTMAYSAPAGVFD